MSRRALLASFAAAPMALGKPWGNDRFWDKYPFPEWTGEQVDRLLTKSPWAREYDLRFNLSAPAERAPAFDYSDVRLPGGFGLPQGQSRSANVRAEAYLTVRWSSALPIRQALALDEHGRNLPAEALEAIAATPEEYVIEVFGLPAIVVHKDVTEMEEELAGNATLGIPNAHAIRVDSVTMPPHGAHLSMAFRFPRQTALQPENKEVLFYAAAGPFEIKQQFKLKDMTYGGQLAV